MGKVLCATRGGKASYSTQDAAIALAKACGDELAFLFVVDICFLKRSRRAVRPKVVAAEMANMGRFLLRMAQERAESQGVRAQAILKQGHLYDTLVTTAREHNADILVLGKPSGDESAYALKDLQTMSADIQAETGIQVTIL